MPDGYLQKAARFLRKRRFREVIRLLEPQVFQFRQNPQYYYLLGVASLYTGDTEGAESYLSRAHQMNERHVGALVGLGAVHFRKGELEESLAKWLEVLEIDPDNRTAKKGLEVLRSDPKVQAYQNRARLSVQLYPPLPPRRNVSALLVIGVVAAAVIASIPVLIRSTRGQREGLQSVELPRGEDVLVAPEGMYRYELSEAQIRETFNRAKRLFNQHRDNRCLVEVNRLLLSNASDEVKETAAILRDYIERPDFSSIRDSFSYREVTAEPHLYQGCYVVWTGKIANLEVGTEEITFDLLVGYHEEKELQGIMPVTLGFAASLRNGGNLEVLGQVLLDEDGLSLKGLSIHKIAERPDGSTGVDHDHLLA